MYHRSRATAQQHDALGFEPPVRGQYGVDVDPQIADQLPDGRQRGAWSQCARSGLPTNLLDDLLLLGDSTLLVEHDQGGLRRGSSDAHAIAPIVC
jgi:hypothetical protein